MRILVIDDHRMFADGLRFVLQQQDAPMELVHAEDAVACFRLLDSGLTPDLILLDLNLPGASGMSILRQLQQRGIWAPILIVSASQSLQDARIAMEQGAMGFVPKSVDGEELLRAIDTVLNGEPYLPGNWSQLLSGEGLGEASEAGGKARLSDRQLEVIHLLAQGHSNKSIASELSLSENTVKVHLRESFRALGVNNRTACVREAQRLGII